MHEERGPARQLHDYNSGGGSSKPITLNPVFLDAASNSHKPWHWAHARMACSPRESSPLLLLLMWAMSHTSNSLALVRGYPLTLPTRASLRASLEWNAFWFTLLRLFRCVVLSILTFSLLLYTPLHMQTSVAIGIGRYADPAFHGLLYNPAPRLSLYLETFRVAKRNKGAAESFNAFTFLSLAQP